MSMLPVDLDGSEAQRGHAIGLDQRAWPQLFVPAIRDGSGHDQHARAGQLKAGRHSLGRQAHATASVRVVARAKHSLVILDLDEVWAFEAKDRLCFVHAVSGKFDIDISLLEVASSSGATFIRVHRNWLANITKIRTFATGSRPYLWIGNWACADNQGIRAPVSRAHAMALRERLLAGSVGLRRNPRRANNPAQETSAR
jgi:LytTr DNA-binding domain